MEDEIEEIDKEPWWKGPLKYILALFLILLLILWYIPDYAVRIDPSPRQIPAIEDVFVQNYEVNLSGSRNIVSRDDYFRLITANDPVVKQTADKIVSSSCVSGRICHVKAILYFVRDNFQYVADPRTFEYVKDARESLAVQGGDCDDASVLLVNLLEAIGIRTRFVFIPGHVYVQAYLPDALNRYRTDGNWVNLDATCRNCKFGQIPMQNINKHKEYLEIS